jgi:hypothetical protein
MTLRTALILILLAAAAVATSPATGRGASPPGTDWGVYVYMGGDYRDVQGPTLDDIEEMERVGSSEQVTLIVQRDGARGAGMRRYRIERAAGPVARRPSTPPLEIHPPIDSGSAASLEGFIRWALARFPARRRVLVLSGHAWGWKGVIQDEQNRSIIPVPAMAGAIGRSLEGAGVAAFDLIVFDCCITGCVEVAHELRGLTRYVVFSPLEMPYRGFPWDVTVARLVARPDMRARELARAMVGDFIASYAPRGAQQDGHFEPVAMAALDLARSGPLFERLGDLGAALASSRQAPADFPDLVRVAGSDQIVDLAELARRTCERGPAEVTHAASGLMRLLRRPVPDPDTGQQRLPVVASAPFDLDVGIEVDPRRLRGAPAHITSRAGPGSGDGRAHESGAHGRGARGVEALRAELLRINPDVDPARVKDFRVAAAGDRALVEFRLEARATGDGRFDASFRPGLGSSTSCMVREPGRPARRVRYASHAVWTDTPSDSALVAEGHSNGTHPCSGPFVFFGPTVPADHVVSGPEAYRSLSWDRTHAWSRFLFGPGR